MIISDFHRREQAQSWIATLRIERIWITLLVVAVAVLGFVNLEYAPRTWFDEGSHLHVPKTIVQHGVYADISSEGYRYHGPTIGIGPTIMLPVALVFKFFGIGLMQGRLVIAGYLLVALVAFYFLARQRFGRLSALLAVTILLASRTLNYDGMIEYGRQVLGEAPGLAFFFLGILAWLGALRASVPRRQRLLSILAGLGFGLVLITKNQFVLIIPPALALLALLDWRYYRAGSWWLRLAPPIIACACFGAWVVVQFQFLGPGTFFENLQQTRQSAGGAIFVFHPRSMLRAGYYILRPDLYGSLLIPALAYTLWRMRQRNAEGLIEALFGITITLWVGWYVLVSLGWPRYAFPAVALSALTITRLITDLFGWLRRTGQHIPALLVSAYVTVIIVIPLYYSTQSVFSPNTSVQRFAAAIEARVPHDVVIETWDPELGVLTDHRYHYPPNQLLDTIVRHEWLGGPPPTYDWQMAAPEFIAYGPFSQYAGVYSEDDLDRDYRMIEHIGQYALFQRR